MWIRIEDVEKALEEKYHQARKWVLEFKQHLEEQGITVRRDVVPRQAFIEFHCNKYGLDFESVETAFNNYFERKEQE